MTVRQKCDAPINNMYWCDMAVVIHASLLTLPLMLLRERYYDAQRYALPEGKLSVKAKFFSYLIPNVILLHIDSK